MYCCWPARAVILAALLAGCRSGPDSRDARIAELEKRVAVLESAAGQQSGVRQKMLESCLWNVNEAYAIDGKSRKVIIGGRAYPLSSSTIDAATKVKQQQVDECRLLYGK